jgi:glutathione S-transferase
MNTIVVHTILLPPERRDETVLGQAQRLLTNALKPIEENLEGKEYLVGDFTAADTMLGHACFMGNRIGCVSEEMTNIKGYIKRLMDRPAFKKAVIDPQ